LFSCSAGVRELLAGFLAPEIQLNLLARFVERMLFLAGDLDDVIAVARLDQIRNFARLHAEYSVVERLVHRAARKGAEVAAFRRGAGVLRIVLRELGKAAGFCFTCFKAARLRARPAFARGRLRVDRDQDVTLRRFSPRIASNSARRTA
jgi:hypothetical protein